MGEALGKKLLEYDGSSLVFIPICKFLTDKEVEPSSAQLPMAFNEQLESRPFTFKADVTVTNLVVFTTSSPSKRIHTCQVNSYLAHPSERGGDLSCWSEARLRHKNGTGRKERRLG